MREVIRGVIDVLRSSGVNRRDDAGRVDDEPFVLPEEGDETREDTAYAADGTRDATQVRGRGDAEARGQRPGEGRRARSAGSAVRPPQSTTTSDETTARLMRGIERLASGTLDEAAGEGGDGLRLSAEATARAQQSELVERPTGREATAALANAGMSDSAREGAEERLLRQMIGRADSAPDIGAANEESRELAERRLAVARAQTTSSATQRLETDQATEATVAMGRSESHDDDSLEAAEAESFEQAQAAREGHQEPQESQQAVTVAQTAAQIVAAVAPGPAVDPTVSEVVGGPTTTASIMEEVIMAQRGPAGGDRVGDADAIIRVSDGAAGALQVKVKRQGDDLSLRVRAEDPAMRNIMAESLPELKQELQRANLIDGQIEVQEDGIDDQMQSEYTWDDERATREEGQEEAQVAPPTEGGSTSTKTVTPTDSTHDGQLHLVA